MYHYDPCTSQSGQTAGSQVQGGPLEAGQVQRADRGPPYISPYIPPYLSARMVQFVIRSQYDFCMSCLPALLFSLKYVFQVSPRITQEVPHPTEDPRVQVLRGQMAEMVLYVQTLGTPLAAVPLLQNRTSCPTVYGGGRDVKLGTEVANGSELPRTSHVVTFLLLLTPIDARGDRRVIKGTFSCLIRLCKSVPVYVAWFVGLQAPATAPF